jgi:hypothetical protein
MKWMDWKKAEISIAVATQIVDLLEKKTPIVESSNFLQKVQKVREASQKSYGVLLGTYAPRHLDALPHECWDFALVILPQET